MTRCARCCGKCRGLAFGIELQAAFLQSATVAARGDLRRSAALCQEAIDLAHASGRENTPMLGWVYARLASLYYEWNEIEKATEYAEIGRRWAERTGISDIFIESSMVRAVLACHRGDREELQSIVEPIRHYALQGRMEDMIESMEAYIADKWLRIGDLDQALRLGRWLWYALDGEARPLPLCRLSNIGRDPVG